MKIPVGIEPTLELSRYERTQGRAHPSVLLLSFPQDATTHRRCAAAIPDMYHTQDEQIYLTIRLSDIRCQGVCRVSEKACWLFEADLGEGLRGYVPRSSYVSMARLRECTESQIPQNSRPDCGGWARLPLSGPWRRDGMPLTTATVTRPNQ